MEIVIYFMFPPSRKKISRKLMLLTSRRKRPSTKGVSPSLLVILLQSRQAGAWDSAPNGPIYQIGE